MSTRKRTYSTSGPSATFKRIKGSFMRQAAASSRMSGRYGARYGARAGVSRETGYVDLTVANYALDTTGSVTLLNTIAQGASVNQRVGKKVVLRGLQCRGNLQNNNNATFNDVAYMVVYDKRPTGALPAITDILVSVSSNAMNNDANAGRFKIMKRSDDVLTGNFVAAQNVTERSAVPTDWYLPLKEMQTVYKAAATGAIADIEEGALYFVTVGNSAPGTAAANAAMAFRLRFKDI